MPYLSSVLYSVSHEIGVILLTILQNRKPRLTEFKQLAQGQVVVGLPN